MPNSAARLEQLGTVFGAELTDRRTTLNAHLLKLEESADESALGAIRRELHILKGAAQAVGATAIEQVAHAAEGAALALRTGTRPPQAWFDALYGGIDALAALQADAAPDTSAVVAALVAVTPELKPVEPIPISALRPNAAAPAVAETTSREKSEQTVRVALGKLDTLLTESGELSVSHLRIGQRLGEMRDLQGQLERLQREWSKSRPARARLRRIEASSARDGDSLVRLAERADQEIATIVQRTRQIVIDLAQNASQLGAVADAIGQEVMAIRLLPAGTIFQPLERVVRDLARQMGKDARLIVSGADTELDRRILDELRDPLLQMVRNTLDHAIEAPQDRALAGKSPQGKLHIAALQRGDRVHITVEDDGRGIDAEAIRETAVRRNLLSAERAEQADTATLIDLIFHPGFSTRTNVSEISGRGVGMDIVRENVLRLGGEISVRTTHGLGTCFTISVPLTLATTRVLVVEDGGQTFAVPSSSIERTGRVRASDLHRLEGRLALYLDGRPLPVVELSEVLQQPRTDDGPASEWRPYFVLPHGDRAVALLADRLIDETELVVKALGAPLTRVRHVGGAAVLGTGAVVVILNPADIIKSALGTLESAPRARVQESTPAAGEPARRRVLVVDDSVMTRTLERTILESAGYAVVVAGDGAQALEVLNETAVDAIVSDVEMPRMNGLDLTTAIRQDERWRHLPIVLVTSLDSPEHVERGAAAGADAYIVKGRFDQNDLLQTVGRLL